MLTDPPAPPLYSQPCNRPIRDSPPGPRPLRRRPRGESRLPASGDPGGVVALCLFFLRLSAPSNLMDNDQERPAAYALDALRNGHWLCQRDHNRRDTSKPPSTRGWPPSAIKYPASTCSVSICRRPCPQGEGPADFLRGSASLGTSAGLWGAWAYLFSGGRRQTDCSGAHGRTFTVPGDAVGGCRVQVGRRAGVGPAFGWGRPPPP